MSAPQELATTRELKKLGAAASEPFSGIFRLARKTARTARNGNPFLSVEFADKFGSFSATCFNDSPAYAALDEAPEGSVVRLDGVPETYNDRFSPRLKKIEWIDEAEADAQGALEQLLETPPEDPDDLWAALEDALGAIRHEALRTTARKVFEELGDAFRLAPAAVSMHHAYRHGLLEHTVHMARACRALLPLYSEVDPDLALAGILLHDVGKIEEYESGPAARPSRRGILQGHVVIGYRVVRKAALQARLNADLTERLEHVVLSHQGQKEWGAAALAATPEAVFVSMIDNLDAKMGMVQRVLRNAAEGETFSERLNGLGAPVLLAAPDKT